jgi:hypothetical protein
VSPSRGIASRVSPAHGACTARLAESLCTTLESRFYAQARVDTHAPTRAGGYSPSLVEYGRRAAYRLAWGRVRVIVGP